MYISARKGIFLLQYLIKLDSVATRRHTHISNHALGHAEGQRDKIIDAISDFMIDRYFIADTCSAYGHTQAHILELNLIKKLKITSHNTRYNLCQFSVTLPRDICTNSLSTFSKWLISHTLTVLMTLFFQRSHEEYLNRQHTHTF